ncbi:MULTISPECIES: winged helix-turn-helix transcriptional regulator [Aerococcus]|uniref:Helix-turn-helix domain-containing protein n=2 Tax=Aerococcus TaxID=1375 RepID=A0A9Q4DC28_9LACT|nr:MULTISPECIES: helix-turn-helix domain-containing protein [Aerococcus]KAA9234496.1 helix-turn-helix transcriptional regulator [Aerococcus mictus]KAA9240646.1 helix-turn-helix transcriptional regulator [Aerococcus urinae]KAA9291850.1 helix-turn-helix transcriptional regulator [Aerococcus mictus]KAA9297921.1 helix-turn-helix transcriptional regulator [Aerococcus tenax]MBU5610059.1 helix-turn-helix transcriptional regulator [Aerococcus urinae]
MSEQHIPSLCRKFEQGFQLLGKKWNGLIIQSLLKGPLRFSELRDHIDGISDRVLTERLRELTCLGILERVTQCSDCHKYTYYALTQKGQDLETVLTSLHSWSDQWIELDK